MNFDSMALINPCDGESRRLFIFNDRYAHNPSGAATNFWRNINIISGLDGDTPYKLIQSIVFWGYNSVSVEERLYNWK